MFPYRISASDASPRDFVPATLGSIQDAFLARNFNVEAVGLWLLGIGVITLVLLAITLVKAIRNRRTRYSPFGSISDPRIIRTVLRTAFEQRRPFEIQAHMEAGHNHPTLRCAPEYLGHDSFTVEATGLKTLSDKWIGRQTEVFFRIQNDQKFTYYTFTSKISGINLPRQDICHLILPIPSTLENRQKRSFLRITPPKEFLLGSAVWCEETMPRDENLHEITAWPRPKLLLLPGRVEQFHLLDISASGMRINIPNTMMRMLDLHFSTAEHLLLMLDLFDPEQNNRLRFWMQCRVQNAWIEYATRNMHMGLQFLSWARPKDVVENSPEFNTAAIEWLCLSSANGIEVLGNWIMRRHLELFREAI